MAEPSCVLTVVKRMTYRGNANEEWSNTYNFTGVTPADSGAWRTLFDALVLEEKKLYQSSTQVIRGYGYNEVPDKGDHAIWTVDLRISPNTVVPGTLASGNRFAGDQAAWVRWGLDRFNTHGKRVYLRKYFHDGGGDSSVPDNLITAYRTALSAFAAKMWDGSFVDGRKICSKDGEVPIGAGIAPYMTTRTLKRRGKRERT